MTDKYLKVANDYPSTFEDFKANIFKHTLKWEGAGKLHKVSGDSGGWTIWGIAYNYNEGLFSDLDDFKDTTYSEAAAIAFVKYYLAIKANKVPRKARLMYFDMAYNLGTMRAIKLMQQCIGSKPDGIIGIMTLRNINNLTEECLYEKRNTFYNYLVRRNIKFRKFIKGWLNRSTSIFNVD